jgi:hypothetical protein
VLLTSFEASKTQCWQVTGIEPVQDVVVLAFET